MKKVDYKKITNGLFDNICDVLIYSIVLAGTSLGKSKTSKGANQALREAEDILSSFNHETIRAGMRKLVSGNLIKVQKGMAGRKITVSEKGLKRFHEVVPNYREKRRWDGKIYLITYDIPETQSVKRKQLRMLIRKMKGEMLLESVWICPYDIKKEIMDFVRENNIMGTVVISNTGRDGAIGEEPLDKLIENVYKLDKINKRYIDFIEKAQRKEKSREELLLLYFSILKDDPQLPFGLLPSWWKGEEAHRLYLNMVGRIGRS